MTKQIATVPPLSKPNGATQVSTTLKIGNVTVHVKSNFHPGKSLYDILLSIVNTKLKETAA